jgi:transposase InsO family protein
VKALCRRYGVTRGGYYAWCGRKESLRARQDERLRGCIGAIFQASDGTYGSPRIHEALQQAGVRVGCKRVARLMREDSHLGLTMAALNAAVTRRKVPAGLIFHSDRGVEYSNYAFRARLAALDHSEHETSQRDRRQCFHRVLLPLDEGRSDPCPRLPARSRSARGRCSLYPSLQSHATPLVVGLSLAHRLRKDCGLTINKWSVNKIGSTSRACARR